MYVLCAAEWSFRAISYCFVHRRTSRFGSRFWSKRDFKNMVELFDCKMQEKAQKSSDFGAFYGEQYRTRTRLTDFGSCFCMFCSSFLCWRCAVLCRLRACRFSPCFGRKAKNKAKKHGSSNALFRWFFNAGIADTCLRTLGNHSTPCMIRGQNTETVQSFIGGHIEKNFVLVA